MRFRLVLGQHWRLGPRSHDALGFLAGGSALSLSFIVRTNRVSSESSDGSGLISSLFVVSSLLASPLAFIGYVLRSVGNSGSQLHRAPSIHVFVRGIPSIPSNSYEVLRVCSRPYRSDRSTGAQRQARTNTTHCPLTQYYIPPSRIPFRSLPASSTLSEAPIPDVIPIPVPIPIRLPVRPGPALQDNRQILCSPRQTRVAAVATPTRDHYRDILTLVRPGFHGQPTAPRWNEGDQQCREDAGTASRGYMSCLLAWASSRFRLVARGPPSPHEPEEGIRRGEGALDKAGGAKHRDASSSRAPGSIRRVPPNPLDLSDDPAAVILETHPLPGHQPTDSGPVWVHKRESPFESDRFPPVPSAAGQTARSSRTSLQRAVSPAPRR